jgi:hypothetical protein
MSVVPSTVLSLWESAGELLLVAEDALSETSGGTPPRSYVSASEPAFDCCPFLTVYVSALTEDTTGVGPGGVAGGHRTGRGSIILATYQILAVRCAAAYGNGGVDIPTPEAIEAVAQLVTEDGWSLWNRIRSAVKCEEIFGTCSEVYFDGGVPIPEQGGCVGWRFTIRAALPGIPRECGEPPPPSVYTETLFTDQADGPLSDPWQFGLDLGYPGAPIPEVSAAVVTGILDTDGHSAQIPSIGPRYAVGVRLSGAVPETGVAGFSCFLYEDADNYYECRFYWDGSMKALSVTPGGGTVEIINGSMVPTAPGGAVGFIVEDTVLSVLQSQTGDLSSLGAVLANPIPPEGFLGGTTFAAFALHDATSIDMVWSREPL